MTPHDPAPRSGPPTDGPAAEADRSVVVVAGPLHPDALAALTADVEQMLAERDVQVVVCDVESYPAADLRVVETLARLALTARRLGRRMRVRHASREVRSFLAFAGLAEVLPCEGGSGSVEVKR